MRSRPRASHLLLKPLVIDSSRRRAQVHVKELWDYRELLFFLVWRDVKVRYKQTVLGIAWAVLQPLLAMLVFGLFFGRLARMESNGLPYPVRPQTPAGPPRQVG